MQNPLPITLFQVFEWRATGDAGVIDQNTFPTESLRHGLNLCLDLLAIRDIDGYCDSLSTGCLDLCRGCLGIFAVNVKYGYCCAGLSQCIRYCLP